jgi:ferric-dicitrate binding protein FerR (iron transport regulator)
VADDENAAHETATHETEAGTAPTERTEAMTTTDTGSTALVGTADDRPRRRGPDPLALLVGLATLAMAVFAFIGELPDLSGFDPRWLLAGGAAVVGLALLVGNLRGRRNG